MKWIKIKDELPPEGVPILISNYEYLNPTNKRFYVTATRNGDRYQEQFIDPSQPIDDFFEPDYWCEIKPIPNRCKP